MYTIPKELIAKWDSAKKGVLKGIDLVELQWTPSEKSKLKADISKMVADFDQGLKAKMKIAAAAKNDVSARKAASDVVTVVNSYRETAKTHADKMGKQGPAVIKNLDTVLAGIARHAEASMKSRAPLTAPSDLYDKFRAGLGEAGKAADAPHRKAVTALVGSTELAMKGAILSVKNSMSDADLHDHAIALRKAIVLNRKKAVDSCTANKWGGSVRRRFERAFDELDRIVAALVHTLETESGRVLTRV